MQSPRPPMLPTRRAALIALACFAFAPRAGAARAELQRPADGWAAEAERLTRRVQEVWWRPERRHYVAPAAYEGTVSTRDARGRFYGHTVWSWCEAFRMLAAAARRDAERWRGEVAAVFDALEQFYDPRRHVYNAWVMFPGNVDSYSDDNAWLVMGLCEATAATGEPRYAERGRAVMNGYVATEWRDDDGPLGMRWGYDRDKGLRHNQRAAISASTAAVAALKLAALGYDAERNRERAATYLAWVNDTCVDDAGLVMDGLQPGRGEGGGWGLERTRWSYNTGLFLIGNALLHEQTGDVAAMGRVVRSADAALDREGRLWDDAVTDPARRHLRDKTFFVPHLLEGWVAASRITGDDRYRAAAEREAAYLYTYVRDAADGLYFRNLRLPRIDPTRRERFKRDFAAAFDAARLPDAYASDERPPAKTLLASAAVAHGYAALGET